WVSPFSNKVTADGWRRLMQQSSATADARRPRAYLNILLFDEQLNLVTAHSIVKQVSALPGKLQVLGEGPSVLKRSGYLYVFLSNESQQDVYFDDLTVSMRHGPVMEETHYYPFGLVMPGISVKALRRPVNNILFNGKTLQQIDGNSVVDQEWYDYGARMFDPQLGRWLSPDKLSEQYESVSPYAYALNDPVNAIDPDGNLIIFVNGFMIHQWMAQDHRLTIRTAQRSMVDRGTFLTEFTQQRNPNFRPYPGERTFAEGAPTYLGKPFQYWGNIDDVFMQGHNDRNARYISASADNASQAHERYADGAMAARRLIRQLDSRQIPLASDETIKIVGHSQGAAFAAGMVSVLSKHAKYSSRLEIAYYIAPHQPGDFLHSAKVKGQQWSTFHDWVTDGWNFIHLFNGGSKNQKIEGIGEGNYKLRDPWVEGMGGHYVETYLQSIIQYFQDLGIKVNVH
ncbi:RHS repeat-associated core domain-containing protein, partial [Chitinophaga sp.]|uniref:RHS repeat-associated core domain-containing protein n=1 Tax=Chitinophaga sp. TaxID=1869181 RepID=UPI002FDEABD3